MAEVILKEIRKRFGDVEVIKGIDIDIADGEFVVFVGPSGCGKSTVLRMIAGLEDITSGELIIGGQVVNDVQPKDRGIAMVFQTYAIFPHMSVRENVAFGLTIAGVDREEKARRVDEAARILQMEHLLDRRPSQLSGGQRQRVAIGRAIVRNPSVFLFDEPLSNLDAGLRMDMRMEIGKLHEQLDATMIYVTHDQVEAMTLADKIVVLKEGTVQQIGAPMDIYHRPANLFVAGFIGSPSMNFMTVDVAGRDQAGVTIEAAALDRVTLPATQVHEGVNARAILGLRPQHLSVSEADGADGLGSLHGSVTLVERLGTETVVDLELELGRGGRLVASLPEDRPLEIGTELTLSFDPSQAHLFALEEE